MFAFDKEMKKQSVLLVLYYMIWFLLASSETKMNEMGGKCQGSKDGIPIKKGFKAVHCVTAKTKHIAARGEWVGNDIEWLWSRGKFQRPTISDRISWHIQTWLTNGKTYRSGDKRSFRDWFFDEFRMNYFLKQFLLWTHIRKVIAWLDDLIQEKPDHSVKRRSFFWSLFHLFLVFHSSFPWINPSQVSNCLAFRHFTRGTIYLSFILTARHHSTNSKKALNEESPHTTTEFCRIEREKSSSLGSRAFFRTDSFVSHFSKFRGNLACWSLASQSSGSRGAHARSSLICLLIDITPDMAALTCNGGYIKRGKRAWRWTPDNNELRRYEKQ